MHPCRNAFQSQFEYVNQTQHQVSPTTAQYGPRFDMASLAAALPQGVSQYGSPDLSQGFPSPNPYQAHHMQYPPHRGPQFMDPAAMARQQQYLGAQFGAAAGAIPNMSRQHGYPMPQQVQYPPIDPYGYGMAPAPFPAIDPRYAQHYSHMMPAMGGMPADMGTTNDQHLRRIQGGFGLLWLILR